MPTYEQAEAARRVLYNVIHTQSKKGVKGYEHNVPCPWCGKHNNHTGLPREKGLVVDCDHCGNLMRVVEIIQKPVIQVKQIHDQPKPPYEPKDRDEWERKQQEAQRVAGAHVDIDRDDAARAQILGIDDRDLVEVFRGLPTRYVQQFAALRKMIGRERAILKLSEWRQQHIAEQKGKTKQ